MKLRELLEITSADVNVLDREHRLIARRAFRVSIPEEYEELEVEGMLIDDIDEITVETDCEEKGVSKTTYICNLPAETQEKIWQSLAHSAIAGDELEIELAMSGRLCDLADTIDITEYLA